MDKSLRTLWRILSTVFNILLVLLICANLYIFAARKLTDTLQPTVLGYSSAIVASGSMSGSIEVNDLIVTRSAEIYKIGDIISFEGGNFLVTHRIVGRSEEGFLTQGDANSSEDEKAVPPDRIIGKVILIIPKLGYILEYLQTPLGMMCMILIALAVVELHVLRPKPGPSAAPQGGAENEKY